MLLVSTSCSIQSPLFQIAASYGTYLSSYCLGVFFNFEIVIVLISYTFSYTHYLLKLPYNRLVVSSCWTELSVRQCGRHLCSCQADCPAIRLCLALPRDGALQLATAVRLPSSRTDNGDSNPALKNGNLSQ